MRLFQHRVIRVERFARSLDGAPAAISRLFLACGHNFLWNGQARIGDVRECVVCRRATNEEAARGTAIRFDVDALDAPTFEKLSAASLGEAMARIEQEKRDRDRRSASGATFEFITADHPTANPGNPDGRVYRYTFPLANGQTLALEMGSKGRRTFERLFLAEMLEHARGSFDFDEDTRGGK